MSHLISFVPGAERPVAAVSDELHRLVEAWTASVAAHLAAPSLVSAPLRLKREPVQLAMHEGTCFRVVRREERLGELLNVLATVVRTADALRFLADTAGGVVRACNPTTSDAGHDVEVVGDDGTHWIVEVSDVAGRGNANGKMVKDLTTLLAGPSDARLLLACSPTSSAWLTNPRTATVARLGVRCRRVATVGDDPDVATHVVAVERNAAT